MEQISFTLGEVTYDVTRLGLRAWLELQEINKRITDAMRDKNMEEAATSICSYLSVITKLDTLSLLEFFWAEIANAYVTALTACIPKTLYPIFTGKSDKPVTFELDYDGRTWHTWSHMLAKNYGWSLEYIADLYFEDGIAQVQEILIDEQLEKEWQWSLSELAYPYNKATKKSEFKPLPRPSWMTSMTKPSKEITVVKLPTDMMPVGLVIKWEQDEATVH